MKQTNTHSMLAGEMDRLQADRAVLRGQLRSQAQEDRFDTLVQDLESQHRRASKAAVLTLVGSTGAGKSTLLNALVGSEVARPGEARPTTRQPVIYAPVDADVSDLVRDLPGEPPNVVRYEPDGLGVWSGQILIDAPDTNSVETLHRQVVGALAERSDVLVVVAHRQAVVEASTVSFLEQFAGMRGLLLVLGHADQLTQEARNALADQMRELALERFGLADAKVHVLSPKLAQANPDTPGWREFVQALFQTVEAGSLGLVRRYNALGAASCIAALVQDRRSVLDAGFDQVEAAESQARTLYRDKVLEEVERRLKLRQRDMEWLLWEEVGKRWTGPGGVALRVGGMASLGLGAGAWMARRNPLLAAGAAAGALAGAKLQSHGRQKAVRTEQSWLPSSSELQGLYEQALVPLRLSLDQAGLSTAGVPSEGEIEEGLSDAVQAGLAQFIDTELLEEAEAGARSPIRLIVDLPIYAFGLWILYRSATGFYRGDYVGMDFLLNAALLAGAWLFLGRTLTRFALRSRAKRLADGMRMRIQEQMNRVLSRCTEPALADIHKSRGAVQRLSQLDKTWRTRLENPA